VSGGLPLPDTQAVSRVSLVSEIHGHSVWEGTDLVALIAFAYKRQVVGFGSSIVAYRAESTVARTVPPALSCEDLSKAA